MSNGEGSSDEYSEEARDAVRSLRSSEIMRTRSMSPNQFSTRRRRVIKSSTLVQEAAEESDDGESPGPRHLEDVTPQELEGAPAGWENNRRARNSSKTTPNLPTALGRRSSAFPFPVGGRLVVPRPSVSKQRRVSQMTFNEWCQLKKFQEIHDEAQNSRRNSQDENDKHLKNIKRNISYEEWNKATQERQKRDTMEHEKLKIKEEEEKEAAETSKYKRRMSFDQWKLVKNATTIAIQKNKGSAKKDENEEERKKKAAEAHRKWAVKKELEEIKKDRDMLLRMQNASLTVADSNTNAPRGRRTSWADVNAALQVQTNRGKAQSYRPPVDPIRVSSKRSK